MSLPPAQVPERSRLGLLPEHLSALEDPRDVRRIARAAAETLLPAVRATMADQDDYDHAAARGDAHPNFLRRHLTLRQRHA